MISHGREPRYKQPRHTYIKGACKVNKGLMDPSHALKGPTLQAVHAWAHAIPKSPFKPCTSPCMHGPNRRTGVRGPTPKPCKPMHGPMGSGPRVGPKGHAWRPCMHAPWGNLHGPDQSAVPRGKRPKDHTWRVQGPDQARFTSALTRPGVCVCVCAVCQVEWSFGFHTRGCPENPSSL